ncbi:hypothetical protein [Bosea sp. 685]|uniref:hypothetical protein n=1 Tax=Bosea sp. 685 TaxID=3080057 RepID=UPI0028933C70|nr:hypothetical protein [Bosea sp. 685]WNJ94134.1 hypothetical protein RMR04_02585 [Bosea sp. 685]
MAAAAIVGSPTPPQKPPDGMITVSTAGISSRRSTPEPIFAAMAALQMPGEMRFGSTKCRNAPDFPLRRHLHVLFVVNDGREP